MLARIVDGVCVEYPYTQLRAVHPQTSFPNDLSGVDLHEFGAAYVVPTEAPAAEPGFVVEETTPALSNGRWRQAWLTRPETVDELAAAKAAAIVDVDAQAEAARLLFVTAGAAQALVYESKRHEALAMVGVADPRPADFPFLSAEVGITAPTLIEVGAAVRATAAQWAGVAAVIEHLRLSAKAAIATAPTAAAARAASTGIAWPQPE